MRSAALALIGLAVAGHAAAAQDFDANRAPALAEASAPHAAVQLNVKGADPDVAAALAGLAQDPLDTSARGLSAPASPGSGAQLSVAVPPELAAALGVQAGSAPAAIDLSAEALQAATQGQPLLGLDAASDTAEALAARAPAGPGSQAGR